ncbi:MAG: hypothetical protein J6V65_03345 [Fibrobacterales bacterium]|nr:hypothetical protein [Fibrobacterales bacterium]
MSEDGSERRDRRPSAPPPGPVLVCRVLSGGVETERQGRVARVYRNDVLAIEASDVLSPPVFFVRDGADWQKLTDWVLLAWSSGGAGLRVPPGFGLRRPLSEEIVENMRRLDVPGRRIAIARLREAGFLPRALGFSPETLPPGVAMEELPSLCLLAPGEAPLRRK